MRITIIFSALIVITLSQYQPQNRYYEDEDQYEEIIGDYDPIHKNPAPHHPGFQNTKKKPQPDDGRRHQNIPPRPQGVPSSSQRPIHHPIDDEVLYMNDMDGPIRSNGHRRVPSPQAHGQGRYRRGMDNVVHSQPHHHHQNMQNIQYSNNNNNKWYSGTFGTIYEIMMIFFLIGLVYNCIFGRIQNDKHALAWYNANKQYFEERYEHIGINKSEMEDLPDESYMKESAIIKETPYLYKFYCSNYRYVKWSLTVLEFSRRFDATSMMTALFAPNRDKIIFELAFNPIDPLGWVFCVCRKREANPIQKNYTDIGYFTKLFEPSVMNDEVCLLSENHEVFMELFNNKNLFPYYKQVEQFLDIIYFSDQSPFSKEPFMVFFSFDINLTYSGQDRRLLEITHFVNLFVDTLAQLKYSKEFKNTVKNNRIMFERTKMEEGKRKEIEEKEKRDFIEKWKIRNKMKNKKGAERRKLQKELEKYD